MGVLFSIQTKKENREKGVSWEDDRRAEARGITLIGKLKKKRFSSGKVIQEKKDKCWHVNRVRGEYTQIISQVRSST